MIHLLRIFSRRLELQYIFTFIIIFAIIYYFLGKEHFYIKNSNSLKWVECFYFLSSMQTLLGIGDITPKTYIAKIIVSLQAILTLAITIVSGSDFI